MLYVRLIRLSGESGDALCDKNIVVLTMQNIESAILLEIFTKTAKQKSYTAVSGLVIVNLVRYVLGFQGWQRVKCIKVFKGKGGGD